MALDGPNPIELNVAYHPSPYPDALRRDLTDIGGVCDGVYVPFTESDVLYGPKRVKACIDIAREVGLITVVDLWGLGNVFASGAVPSLLALRHPELNCVDPAGQTLPKLCVCNDAARILVKNYVTDFITRFQPDGVFWDEPSWSLPSYLANSREEGDSGCRCEACRSRYREQFGEDMPDAPTEEVRAFHDTVMVDFLGDLCTHVKGLGDHLITATCVRPGDALPFKEAVGRTPRLDIFGIDPYWRPDMDVSQKAYIEEHVGEAVRIARANGKLVEAWVCAYDIRDQHERDPYRAAKFAAAQDIDALNAWSYRDYLSWAPVERENPGDPELVWKNLSQAYHEIREGQPRA